MSLEPPYFSSSPAELTLGDKLVVGLTVVSAPLALTLQSFVFERLRLSGSAVAIALTLGLLWMLFACTWVWQRRPLDPKTGTVIGLAVLTSWGLGFVIVMCAAGLTATVADTFQAPHEVTNYHGRLCRGTFVQSKDPSSGLTFSICERQIFEPPLATVFEGKVLRGPLGVRLVSWQLVRPAVTPTP